MYQSKYQIPNSVVKASRNEIDELELELGIFKKGKSNEESFLPVENLPDDLSGYVFIAAPLPYGDGSFVLNGDGMIHRLELMGGKAKLKMKIAKTPCYYADLAIENQPNKYPSNFKFRNGGSSRMSSVLGSRNQLNTAFLKTSEKLFITFDAGRPYEIDPNSLEVLEPIGSTTSWKQIFPLSNIFGTYSNPAHPVCDLKGLKSKKSENNQEELFTINYSTGYKGKFRKQIGKILQWIKHKVNNQNPIKKLIDPIQSGYANLICYDLKQELQMDNTITVIGTQGSNSKPLEARKECVSAMDFYSWEMRLPDGEKLSPNQTIHQMAITEDYIIFMDIAFKIEFSQIFSPFWLEPINKLRNNIINILDALLSKYTDIVKKFFQKFGTWIYSVFLRFIPPEPYTNFYIIDRQLLSKKIEEARRQITECTRNKSEEDSIKVKKVTIPREVSHFTVDYTNPDNKIILHIGHNNGSDVTEWVRKYDLPARENKLRQEELAGMIVGTTDLGCLGRYVIDAEAGIVSDARIISDPRFTWSLSVCTHLELSNESIHETADTIKNIYWMSWGFSWETIPERIYRAYKDSSFRHVHHSVLPEDYKPTQLLRLDTEKMEIVDSFEFPYGHFACTPQFIPSSLPCPEDKDPSIHGYIICVVLADASPENRDNPENSNQPQDEFWILYADDFNQKPVYRLRAPSDNKSLNIDIGLTIHSTWLREINKEKYSQDDRRKKREKSVYEDYHEDFNEDYRELIKKYPEIKKLFETVIYPHFIDQTSEAEFLQDLNKNQV